MLSTQCLCPSSQEQQFTAPVPQHFPAQGQGAGSSCHRWILLCCCQGSPWSFGMCLCLLASLKSVHSGTVLAGGTGASLPGMCLQGWKAPRNSAQELLQPPHLQPAALAVHLGSDGKCLIRKQFFFLNSFLFHAHTFI